MRIYFLVPGFGQKPSGGIRVIYEHANRLAQKGHEVDLLHFLNFPIDGLRQFAKKYIEYISFVWNGCPQPQWFALDEKISCHYYFFPRLPKIENGSSVVATYFKTHFLIDNLNNENYKLFYFIQGIEDWVVDKVILERQWAHNSTNLVVSRWLKDEVDRQGNESKLVPNAIDFDFFKQLRDQKNRKLNSVIFCSMNSENKGSREVVDAINQLRRRGVQLEVLSFGDKDPSGFGLEGEYRFEHLPSQEQIRDLYNEAVIFCSASRSEGWGLTLGEATACGAALVVSDAKGHFEFATPDKSALFFKRGDVKQLADSIEHLVNNPKLRVEMVRSAQKDLNPYTWEEASRRMEQALLCGVNLTA